MMKKYLILIISLIIFSCSEDFLSLYPEDQTSGGNFFITEEHFTQAINAAYQPLRSVEGIDFVFAEMRSDNTHYDFYPQDRGNGLLHRENIADFTDDKQNTITNPLWINLYNGVSKSNIVLTRIEGAKLSDAFKNNIIGQAKFLRAFYYFKLVRYFGGVPLHVKEVTTSEGAFLPRATSEEVYNVIVEDLKDAGQKLSVITFPQSGRATKGAAMMLLAEVYMTQKKYADAESLLKSITQMGYELLPNYASVFSTSNKNSKESIFEVQYQMGTQGQQSNFIYMFLPHIPSTTPYTGVNYNNINIGGWNMPTQDIIDSYEPGDSRLDASIAIAEGSINSSGNFQATGIASIINYQAPEGIIGKPFVKKYLNPHTLANNTDDNWPVYRYSDALLLLAESLNEQSKSSEALPYLNQVRLRAGLSASNQTNQSTLRDIIAHERRIELAFENHRWHDLVRTGKAISVMTAYGNNLKQIYSYLTANSYQVNENRLLFPIPYEEETYNINLGSNNPGY
jgi:hypothetical protein